MTESEARELLKEGSMPIFKQWGEELNENDICIVKELLEDTNEYFVFHVAVAPEGTDPEKLCSYEESKNEDGPGEYYGGMPMQILKDTAEISSGMRFY